MLRMPLLALLGVSACATAPLRVAEEQSVVGPRYLPAEEARAILLDAARAGDVEVVSGLIGAGVPIEADDDKGYTPLILAAYHGHTALVAWLLDHGADACNGDARGNTALMGAAFKGETAIVDILLVEDCPVDKVNGVGQTALMFAALVGNDAAARILAHGADRGVRDEFGRTASDWAETQGAPEASDLRPKQSPQDQ